MKRTTRSIRLMTMVALAGVACGEAPTLAQEQERPTAGSSRTSAGDLVLSTQLPTQQHFTHSAVRRLRLFRSDPGILGTRFGRITWSYMPDGISIESAIPQGSEPPGDPVPPGAITKLFARLAEPPPVGFGSQRAWQTIVANCFARWEAISGVTFEFAGNGEAVADDENGDSGERWDQNAPGWPEAGTTGAGDIRITMRELDGRVNPTGTNVNLAWVYDPHEPPGPDAVDEEDVDNPINNLGYLGNIILDEDELWNDPAVPNLFETVMMRSIGRAIGLAPACPYPDYSSPGSIEATLFSVLQHQDYNPSSGIGDPYPQLVYQTPQQDDIRQIQFAWGDPLEDNDSYALATWIEYAPPAGSSVFTYAPHIVSQQNPTPRQLSLSGRGAPNSLGSGLTPVLSPNPFDTDRFRIALPQSVISADLTVTIEPIGEPYIDGVYNPASGECEPISQAVDPRVIQNLGFRIESFDPFTNTLTTLIEVDDNPVGMSESFTVPVDSGIYFITVFGDLVNDVQLYNLTVTVETAVSETGIDFGPVVEEFGIDEFDAIGATGFDVTYGNVDAQHVADHDVFLGRDIVRISWPGVQPAVTTASPHATTVAAVATGDVVGGFRGLARDAEIVSGAVATDVFADGTFAVGKNALYYSLFGMADPTLSSRLGLFQPASVISSTWAGGSRILTGEDSVSQAYDAVVSMTGVTMVIAAGNNGTAERQGFENCPFESDDEFSPGAVFKGSRSLVSPATAYNGITVGAIGTSDGAFWDIVANFSSRGPVDIDPLTGGAEPMRNVRSGIDIVAPGTGVTEIPQDFNPPGGEPPDPCLYQGPIPQLLLNLPSIAPGDDPDAPQDPTYTQPAQGTSVAAGFVAGVVALLQDAARIQDPPLSTAPEVMKAILLNGAVKLTGWSNTGAAPGQPQDQRNGFRYEASGVDNTLDGIIEAFTTEFPLDVAQGAGLVNPARSLQNFLTGYPETLPPQAQFDGPTIDPPETDPKVPTITMPNEPSGIGGPGLPGVPPGRPAGDMALNPGARTAPPSVIELVNLYHRASGIAVSPGEWSGRSLQFSRDDPDLKNGRGPADEAVNVGPMTPIKIPNLGGGPGPGPGGPGPGVPPGAIDPGVQPREIEPLFVDPIGWDHANIDARVIRFPGGGSALTGWIDYVISVPLSSGGLDPDNPGVFREPDRITVTLCWNRDLELSSVNFDDPNDPRIGNISRHRFDNLDLFLFQCDALGNPTGQAQRASVSRWSNVEHISSTIPNDGTYLIRVQWVAQEYDVLANTALAELPFALAWRVDFNSRLAEPRPANMSNLLSALGSYGARIGRYSPAPYSLEGDYNRDGKVDFRDITDIITNWAD